MHFSQQSVCSIRESNYICSIKSQLPSAVRKLVTKISILISISMRNVYKSLMVIGTSFLLGAGTMWADGRYWTYDASAGATAPDNVQAGQPYFLQTGRSEAAGAAWFLWGDRFKSTSSLTSDFVYYFEEVPGRNGQERCQSLLHQAPKQATTLRSPAMPSSTPLRWNAHGK